LKSDQNSESFPSPTLILDFREFGTIAEESTRGDAKAYRGFGGRARSIR